MMRACVRALALLPYRTKGGRRAIYTHTGLKHMTNITVHNAHASGHKGEVRCIRIIRRAAKQGLRGHRGERIRSRCASQLMMDSSGLDDDRDRIKRGLIDDLVEKAHTFRASLCWR
jgi:hypothetical protein